MFISRIRTSCTQQPVLARFRAFMNSEIMYSAAHFGQTWGRRTQQHRCVSNGASNGGEPRINDGVERGCDCGAWPKTWSTTETARSHKSQMHSKNPHGSEAPSAAGDSTARPASERHGRRVAVRAGRESCNNEAAITEHQRLQDQGWRCETH